MKRFLEWFAACLFFFTHDETREYFYIVDRLALQMRIVTERDYTERIGAYLRHRIHPDLAWTWAKHALSFEVESPAPFEVVIVVHFTNWRAWFPGVRSMLAHDLLDFVSPHVAAGVHLRIEVRP